MFTLPECKWTHIGREYVGTLNTTVSGRTCQAWTSNYPHVPSETSDLFYPYESRALARNYCRNPDIHAVGLWCYTTDPNMVWEPCNVPYCGESNGYPTLVLCEKSQNMKPTIVANNVALPTKAAVHVIYSISQAAR